MNDIEYEFDKAHEIEPDCPCMEFHNEGHCICGGEESQ